MACIIKQVTTEVGSASVTIEAYSANADDRVTITIDGISCHFPVFPKSNLIDTLEALKEAAAAL